MKRARFLILSYLLFLTFADCKNFQEARKEIEELRRNDICETTCCCDSCYPCDNERLAELRKIAEERKAAEQQKAVETSKVYKN